jgi:hypothetical protein
LWSTSAFGFTLTDVSAYRWAAMSFGLLALIAGGLQAWAYVASGSGRHLIAGVFAVAVGVCVIGAVLIRRGNP